MSASLLRPEPGDIAFLAPVGRDNLTGRVYGELRAALMEGRMRPGQRLKMRELALQLGVSETPVREAVMQLVRERALHMEQAKAITVAGLTLAQYRELRRVRAALEGLAAEEAAVRITAGEIRALERAHAELVRAEAAEEGPAAVRANWRFHHGLYRAAAMPELLAVIEGIWLRNGPMLNHLYPHARPTYPGRHRHLDILDGLRARDPAATRSAVQADMEEGGAGLLRHLTALAQDGMP
ncbi:GntR family transcriptional regulator [Falsiroseomonas selenitidurans]|uniref:GntR family transcriptional regulator n=1 Tax=Falsiroseomonas selenitidurans TaxID=2716335 RepID=A0ABX1E8G3_9PROT|nr:GntR family transcriptional regulator [Falsiroseomonas selenitidurans]NKC31180.1 GntR family transcriptional regulator [Falsiroseomonas selenitidurans]